MLNRIVFHRAADGVRLAVGAFTAQEAGPVVILLHGIASHMGWYRGMAEMLQVRGVSVYMLDRRGVARSEGPRGDVLTWRVLSDDVADFAAVIERQHPAQPIHIMGISLGSAVAVACALRHPGLFRSLVLLSPALATSVRVPPARKLATLVKAITAPSTLVDLPFGLEQMTTNREWREALNLDLHRTRQVTARFLLQVLSLQRFVRRSIHQLGLPVLALLGGADEIVDNETSIRLLNKVPCAPVRVEVFEAVPHILAASVPRAQLADRVMTWLAGDHRSASQRFSQLRTVISHDGTDCIPPRFAEDAQEPAGNEPAR